MNIRIPVLFLLTIVALFASACDINVPAPATPPGVSPTNAGIPPTAAISAAPTGSATATVSASQAITETFQAALEKNQALSSYRAEMSFKTGDNIGLSWKGEVRGADAHFTYSVGDIRDAQVIGIGDQIYLKNKDAGAADEWFVVSDSEKALYRGSAPRSFLASLVGAPSGVKTKSEMLDGVQCDVYARDKATAAAIFMGMLMGQQVSPNEQATTLFDEAEGQVWLCADGYIHQASLSVKPKPQPGQPASVQKSDFIAHLYDFNADIQITAPANVRPMPTGTPLPTETPLATNTPLPTPLPAQATATAQAALSASASIGNWDVLLSDEFDVIANDWTTDSFTTDEGKGKVTKKIEDGKYTWNVRSATAIVNRDLPKFKSKFLDGAIQVDAKWISGATTCASGVTLRDDFRNYYYFVIRADGTWKFARGVGQARESEITSDKFSGIRNGEANRLMVIQRTGEFLLFVNDQFIRSIPGGENPDPAVSGLAMELNAPDEACVVEFDNFQVRVPSVPSANAQGQLVVSGFDSANAANFPVGAYDQPPLAGKREIADGKYVWEMLAPQAQIEQFAIPKMDAVTDFTAAVTIKTVQGPERAWAGLAFRRTGAKSYYKFDVTNSGSYAISVEQDGDYDSLVFPTSSSVIKKGEPNRLMVVAKGSRFYFYINGELVTQIENPKLEKGSVSLVAMVYEPGATGVFEFSDFQVRVP